MVLPLRLSYSQTTLKFVFDSQQAEQTGALLAKVEQNNATKHKDKGTPCKVLMVTEWYARVSLANDCPWKGN